MVTQKVLVALFLLIAVGAASGQEAGPHTFTDQMGRRSPATITAATAETVTLRGQNGQEIILQITTLSEADRRYIAQWIEMQKTPGKAPQPALPSLPAAVRGVVEYQNDGAHCAFEEEIRWLVNRGRFDSAKENAQQGTSFRDVPKNSGPLAPHRSLIAAARRHSEDMARNNSMQHDTLAKSAFYNAAAQRTPWARAIAEGYPSGGAAENICAGTPTALATYLSWWKSGGHRKNMYAGEMREIGNGHFTWPQSRFKHYYAMNLGGSPEADFFTCTLFHDATGRGVYAGGSGVGGIRIDLRCDRIVHDHFDVSAPAGSFAVPLHGILPGAHVEVLLTNTNAVPAKLAIPQDYENFSIRELAPGEQQTLGFFTRSEKPANVGFRHVIHSIPKVSPAASGE